MTKDESTSLAQSVVEWGLNKKAEDVVLLDMAGLSDVTDSFVLMTGTSQIQIQAIADAIIDGALEEGIKPLHMEGRDTGRWVLIDFVDVIVHVMQPDMRSYYSLERLWGDAPVTRFDEAGRALGTAAGGSSEE